MNGVPIFVPECLGIGVPWTLCKLDCFRYEKEGDETNLGGYVRSMVIYPNGPFHAEITSWILVTSHCSRKSTH